MKPLVLLDIDGVLNPAYIPTKARARSWSFQRRRLLWLGGSVSVVESLGSLLGQRIQRQGWNRNCGCTLFHCA